MDDVIDLVRSRADGRRDCYLSVDEVAMLASVLMTVRPLHIHGCPVCKFWPELDRLREDGIETTINLNGLGYSVEITCDLPVNLEVCGEGKDLDKLLGKVTGEFWFLQQRAGEKMKKMKMKKEDEVDYSFRDEIRSLRAVAETARVIERSKQVEADKKWIVDNIRQGAVAVGEYSFTMREIKQMNLSAVLEYIKSLGFWCASFVGRDTKIIRIDLDKDPSKTAQSSP